MLIMALANARAEEPAAMGASVQPFFKQHCFDFLTFSVISRPVNRVVFLVGTREGNTDQTARSPAC